MKVSVGVITCTNYYAQRPSLERGTLQLGRRPRQACALLPYLRSPPSAKIAYTPSFPCVHLNTPNRHAQHDIVSVFFLLHPVHHQPPHTSHARPFAFFFRDEDIRTLQRFHQEISSIDGGCVLTISLLLGSRPDRYERDHSIHHHAPHRKR